MKNADVLVIGAGVIGSSVAAALADRGVQEIVVVDPDLAGTLASSTFNFGGVRATWSSPVNIAMSRRSIDYFASVAHEVSFRRCGYLYVHDRHGWERARADLSVWQAHGLSVDLLGPSDVRTRFPLLDRLADVAGAVFSPDDGLVDSRRVRDHFRARAEEGGVRFVDRTAATRLERDGDSWSVRLRHLDEPGAAGEFLVRGSEGDGRDSRLRAESVVICVGPWARRYSAQAGLSLDVRPVRRQLFEVDLPRTADVTGMVVDTSGAALQLLGSRRVVCAYANPEEPAGIDLRWEGSDFFERRVLPKLLRRSSAFEGARLVGGHARLYEVSPDDSGVLGPVPGVSGVFEAHSFSGHGVMQSYAAGEALAERILYGRWGTWSFASSLGRERFRLGRPIRESTII